MPKEANPTQDTIAPNPEQKAESRPKNPEAKGPAQKRMPKKVSDVLQSVHIALDGYDDIFSDFDPSPYETRILSDDFLNELHKRYVETPKGAFSITLSLPKAYRSEKTESLIKKRIKDYFKGRLKDLDKTMQEKLRRGILRVGVGASISFAVIVIWALEQPFITALISPLIWYLMWSGFESIFEVAQSATGRSRPSWRNS